MNQVYFMTILPSGVLSRIIDSIEAIKEDRDVQLYHHFNYPKIRIYALVLISFLDEIL